MEFFSFLAPLFSAKVLWIVLGIAILFYALSGSIFVYHWNSYSSNDRRVKRMKMLYFAGGALILVTGALFLVSL